MQQQRKWPRVKLKAQVQMRFSSLEAMSRGALRDLSVGGAFVFTRAPRPVGTRISLVVTIEDNDLAFEAEGEVVHVVNLNQASSSDPVGRNAAGMGLRFLALTKKIKILSSN